MTGKTQPGPIAFADLERFHRIVVVGSSGTGKTTLALRIAEELDLPRLELDSIRWAAGWQPRDDFAQRVDEFTSGERWVIEGNYRSVRDLIWRRADALVWLNLPLRVALVRAIRRTMQRIRSGQPTHGGNRETILRTLLSPNGIPWWVIRSHHRRRREYRQMFDSGAYPNLTVIEVRN